MKMIDVSLDLSASLPVWPGDPRIEVKRVKKINAGDSCNVSHLHMGAHTGTHVDAPLHFIKNGRGVESLKLEILMGEAYVVHLSTVENITSADLAKAKIPARTKRLLIKTKNSNYWKMKNKIFQKNFIGVLEDAACWIVKQGIQLVGVDYLSVAPYKEGIPTHVTLLKAGVVIVEGLNLSSIHPGKYEFICLPLKIIGCDGAPARAVLIEK